METEKHRYENLQVEKNSRKLEYDFFYWGVECLLLSEMKNLMKRNKASFLSSQIRKKKNKYLRIYLDYLKSKKSQLRVMHF